MEKCSTVEPLNISEIHLLIVLQIIYVTRNPKDVMVSYYHFSKYMKSVEEIADFNLFMERFLSGKGRIFLALRSPNLVPWPLIKLRIIISINKLPGSSTMLSLKFKAAEVA